MGGALKGASRSLFAPLAAAAAGVGVVGFFKDAIAGASDLNENATKIQAIFGGGTKAVERFASRGAKALGQTQNDVLNASATFGTFGKAAGLSGNDLAKFSTGFAGLSTDLASFNNTSPEQAVEAIGAALRGESEPIRQYGVLLDDATLRNSALRLGLIKTTKDALTPQQKVLAAQAEIYRQTKDAQGDFARTSGGLANQQRILSAQFSDFKTTLGAALLPIIVKVVTFLNNSMLPGLRAVGAVAQQAFGVLFQGDFKGGPLSEDSKAVDVLFRLRDGLIKVGGIAKQAFNVLFRGDFTHGPLSEDSPAVDNLFKLRDALISVGRFVTGSVVPAFASLAAFLGRNADVLVPLVAVIFAAVKIYRVAVAVATAYAAVQAVVATATAASATAGGVLNAVLAANPIGLVVVALAALAAGLVVAYKRSETFRKIVQGAWAGIRTAVSASWNFIRVVFAAVVKFFGATIPNAARTFGRVVGSVWAGARNAITGAWRVISGVFAAVVRWYVSTVVAALRLYLRVLTAVWRAAFAAVRASWGAIRAVFSTVVQWLSTRLTNSLRFYGRVLGAVWSAAGRTVSSVWTGAIRPAFNALKTAIGTTLPGAFRSGGAAIKAAWDKVRGYVARPVNFVIGTVLNHGLLAAFNSVAGSVLGKKAPHINSLPLVKFAEGSEDHRAQIARPNQLRVWAEPETGGEAYIPLAQRKRARSTQILSKVAQHFGYGLTQFADGGTLVKAGKHLRQLGYNVAEGPAPFGPVHRVHTAGSAHYRGLALDINHGAGTSRAEQAALDRIVPYLKGLGLRVIWRAPGHYNHLHTEATGKGSILGRLVGGAGDLLSSLDPRKLIGKGLDKLGGIPGAGSTFAKIAGGVPRKLLGMLVDKAKSVIASVNPFSDTSDPSGGGGGGGANRWAGVARQVLAELGRPAGELGALLRRIQFESGGNPKAINLTDINARRGTPSKGLMQTIGSTFNAFAGKYRSRGIYDPLANIYAGSRYAISRYGSLAAIDPRNHPKGYDKGGILPPGGLGANYGRAPERVLTPSNTASFDRLVRMLETGGVGGGGVQFNAPVYTQTPEEFARRLVADQRLHEALHPTF